MMSDPASVLRRLLVALAGVVLLACATAVAADASYGEIGHFGELGSGPGQFNPGESPAIGVDPRNNSVYVVDQPNPEKEDEFRIQKFEATEPGKYKAVASMIFKPHDDEGEEEGDLLEGVVVDTHLNRVYVLASEVRRPEKVKIDGQDEAASQLFAFSTKQSGEKLVPAEGTSTEKGEEGVLAGTKVLQPLSNKAGTSLLEPTGIAVDEHEGDDILIVGQEQKVEGEARVAVQQVKPTGELGERWVDESNVLEGEVDSAAVSATGDVYLESFDALYEVPSSFSDSAKPVLLPSTDFAELLKEELVEFPGQPEPESGGALTIGEEGTIYTKAGIARQFDGSDFKFPGILEFNSKGEEEGWTGGQSVAAVGKTGPCKMSLIPAIQIAAGKEHIVFAYDAGADGPRVIEFGPGGGGCAAAEATEPEASVNGQVVSETEKIPVEDKVTLSSTLTQANALSVKWNFDDGTEETVSSREYQHVEITHKFAKTGPLTVTATIHTDDLADPVVEVKAKVDILGPEASTGAAEKVEETSAVLTGTVDPNEATVSECFFEYGTSVSYGQVAPCKPKASELKGEKPIAVTAAPSGLTRGSKYDYQLVVKYGASDEIPGGNKTFTTPSSEPKPIVLTGSTKDLTQTSATLEATVNPNGEPVEKCEFEYGTSTSYGKTAPCTPEASKLGSGTAAEAVTAAITSLSADTTYHFRIVATGAGGTSEGADAKFTTLAEPKPPTVLTEAASAIGKTSATLNATVNPNGWELKECEFEYGPTTSYGKTASCKPDASELGSGTEARVVALAITGLGAGTTYHFRIVASNVNGEEEKGADSSFTTEKESTSGGGGGGGGGGGNGGGGGGGNPGEGEVKHFVSEKPPAEPIATLAGSPTSVGSSGTFTLKVTCPAEETNCSGEVTLKTLKAVLASVGREAKSKAAILTLASASFNVAGGKVETVTLHLSSKGRALLAHTHSVSARVTIVAHDSAGRTHTTTAIVTLRPAKPAKKGH
jgi:hypothetical protein